MQLLISGADQGEKGAVGVLAKLLVFDTDRGEVVQEVEYASTQPFSSPEHKMQFTGFAFIDGDLYVCAHNEIVVYENWPLSQPSRTISLQGFNDLHHLIPYDGAIAVSNTGLETVDLVDYSGRLLNRWDLLRCEQGARRIDPDFDYRRLPDTKPHSRHANHLFEWRGELWTSQLNCRNAVCVTADEPPLAIEVGMPHDGEWIGGHLYFTTTNGYLVEFNEQGIREQSYNLAEMTPGLEQLGWCRGVCQGPGQTSQVCVGFSSLRRSKWKNYAYFVKHGHALPASRVATYDLDQRRMLKSWQIGPGLGYQIFQVHQLAIDQYI